MRNSAVTWASLFVGCEGRGRKGREPEGFRRCCLKVGASYCCQCARTLCFKCVCALFVTSLVKEGFGFVVFRFGVSD